MSQEKLTDGKREWTPANAEEATNLKARGWKPVAKRGPAVVAEASKQSK